MLKLGLRVSTDYCQVVSGMGDVCLVVLSFSKDMINKSRL